MSYPFNTSNSKHRSFHITWLHTHTHTNKICTNIIKLYVHSQLIVFTIQNFSLRVYMCNRHLFVFMFYLIKIKFNRTDFQELIAIAIPWIKLKSVTFHRRVQIGIVHSVQLNQDAILVIHETLGNTGQYLGISVKF